MSKECSENQGRSMYRVEMKKGGGNQLMKRKRKESENVSKTNAIATARCFLHYSRMAPGLFGLIQTVSNETVIFAGNNGAD